MDKNTYDFSGWATKNNIRCSDGRTIRKDAFKVNDGETVPLVWNHDHKDAESVLGHALLENREEGVYAYCSFNNTKQGLNAKELVKHGDVRSLSIYANQLKQSGDDVIHGRIREVSLVLAGANYGAFIDTVIAHSDDHDEEAHIYHAYDTPSGLNDLKWADNANDKESENNDLKHGECDPKPDKSNNKENKNMGPENKENKEKTVKDVFDAFTEEEKNVVYFLIEEAVKAAKDGENNSKEQMEDKEMKHNAFDNEIVENTLSHADMETIVSNARKGGSFRDAFNDFVADNDELAHSITDVGNLFPEATAVNKTPELISRNVDWVKKVMGAVHHTPFSRVKSTAANITAEDARAKGYVKGKKKVEEVIAALKRTTTPTTVYKLQKMDRDDVLDITDFDVIAWLKVEMRQMLDEEIARAILVGDGRQSSSDDKINPLNIRPILGDDSVYTVAKTMERNPSEDDCAFAKRFIKEALRARKEYKGSGNPALYTTEDMLTNMLLIEDKNERVIYDTVEKLKTALRVSDIVTSSVLENVVRTDGSNKYTFMGMFVNLADYNVGADKGGAVSLFDDFDINYNKMEYLIETRCSGALVKPYSAITFEEKSSVAA